MEITKDLLKIDAAKVAEQLAGFIRDQVKGFFKRKGAVIGLSGGIDSAVAGALCVKALERNGSTALSSPSATPSSQPEYGSPRRNR